jgi:hypothetical protein
MKKMHKVVAVVLMVAALAVSQSAVFAAPTQGMSMATSHSESTSLFGRFLTILTAIWGGDKGAVWTGGAGGGNNTAIWGSEGRG